MAVATELHFGRAAEHLHVAQPAVSQTIASLERELGLILFERSSRGVSLTPAGHALLPHASAAIERADAVVDAARDLRSGSTGRVTVGVAPALPPRVLIDLLAAARRDTPGIRVVAKSLTRADPLAALVDRTFDLVLMRGPVSAAGVASIVVASERVGLAIRADHPLAAMHSVPAAALDHEPLVGFARRDDPVQFDRLFGALHTAGLTRPGELHESPPGAVDSSLRLVAAGEALSLKLRSEVDAFADPGLVWRPLQDFDLDVEIHLAWRIDLTNVSARAICAALGGL